nr:hypothetical protein [Bacillus sp. FJAT-47783]
MEEQSNGQNEKVENHNEDVKRDNSYIPNPQVTDDRSLINVGDTYRDEKGEAQLKAMIPVHKNEQIGPIELTIKHVKVIHLIPDYSLIDYFHGLTHEKEFDFVKVQVEMKNSSDKEVYFAPIALLETSTGESFDWNHDIYLENLNGPIKGNETKAGNLGFILEKRYDGNIKSIQFMTSDVVDEQQNKMSEAEEIKINF